MGTPDDDERQDEERDAAPRQSSWNIDAALAPDLDQLRELMDGVEHAFDELRRHTMRFRQAMDRFIDGGGDAKQKAERMALIAEVAGNSRGWAAVLLDMIEPTLRPVSKVSRVRLGVRL